MSKLMDTTDLSRTPIAAAFSLLPLAASQAYTVWQVAAGNVSYFQVMVLNAAEVWLVMLISVFFFSPTMNVFGRRVAKQLGMTGAIFVLLTGWALAGVSGVVVPGAREQPLYRMFDLIGKSLTSDLLGTGLIFIGINLGLSLLLSFAAGNASRRWYSNVIMPVFMTLAALFLSMMVFFVLGLHNSQEPGLGSLLFLVITFSALRLLFAWLFQKRSDPAQLEAEYSAFLTGEN